MTAPRGCWCPWNPCPVGPDQNNRCTCTLDAAERVRDAIFASLTGLGIFIRDGDYKTPIVRKFLERAQEIAMLDRAKLAEIIAEPREQGEKG